MGAIKWTDKNNEINIRVYSVAQDGSISEDCYIAGGPGSNWHIDPNPIFPPGTASSGSGIAAILFGTGSIHLYFLDPNGNIAEGISNDGSAWTCWTISAESDKFPASSAPEAIVWADGDNNSVLHIRLYAMNSGIKQEYCYDDGRGWQIGALLP